MGMIVTPKRFFSGFSAAFIAAVMTVAKSLGIPGGCEHAGAETGRASTGICTGTCVRGTADAVVEGASDD